HREDRFNNVKTVQVALRRINLATLRETTNGTISIFFRANKIAIERENAAGVFQFVFRRDGLAESDFRSFPSNAQINRLINMPARFREFLADDFLQALA